MAVRKKILLTALVFLMPIALLAEIVVKQEKDGRIIVSNLDTSGNYVAKFNGVSFENSPGATIIPQHYMIKIKKLAEKYGVRESLIVAVARAESSFNPFAVSRKGAIGIMQLMPDTARKYGVFNRYNVDQNLDAGVRHLKYLYQKYNKNLPLTLAAYNAGEDAVKKYNGIPPFKETRTYIKRVMKYMGLGYSSYFSPKVRQKIYKIVTTEGRIIITDQLPSKVEGQISIID
jgi:soluble lytic murein transglycosylase-like protein